MLRVSFHANVGRLFIAVRFSSTSASKYEKQLPFVSWYYATDKPKRQSFRDLDEENDILTQKSHSSTKKQKQLEIFLQNEEYYKKPAKKFKPFNKQDSANLEKAYQQYISHMQKVELKKGVLITNNSLDTESQYTVQVNEDKLFQVDIHRWELEPVYWEGAVYEVRRGAWFTPDKTPVNASVMIQLESHYQKLHKSKNKENGRSQNKKLLPNTWSASADKNSFIPLYKTLEYCVDYGLDPTTQNSEHEQLIRKLPKRKPTHYLYFNDQDLRDETVFVIPFDQKSYYSGGIALNLLRNGIITIGVTKLSRNINSTEQEKQQLQIDSAKSEKNTEEKLKKEAYNVFGGLIPQSVSNLVSTNWASVLGVSFMGSKKTSIEEQKRKEQEAAEKTMKEEIEKDFDTSNTDENSATGGANNERQIDHLVFCIHGIGQTLGRKYQYVNFSHTVNVLRKNIKTLYGTTETLQKLNENDKKNSRIQVLPITWRHRIGFNTEDMDKNRSIAELPTLLDLTLDGVKPIRKLIGDIALDILLYDEEYYQEKILKEVISELNRIHELYCKNNPNFKGKVSVIGHSLGSLIFFDILSKPELAKQLNFNVVNFFGIGSPVGVFKLIQRTMIGDPALSFNQRNGTHKKSQSSLVKYANLACENFYNVYHMCDPIGFRVEPLVDRRMAHIEQESVRTLSATNQIAAKVLEISESLPSPNGSSVTVKDQYLARVRKTDGVHLDYYTHSNNNVSSKIALNKDLLEKLLQVNKKNGRVDYSLKSGLLEMDVINAIKSHVSYFEDLDVSGFLVSELLKKPTLVFNKHVELKK
ncbi:hypothetical protein ACO0QE_000605 [Hanseniaspora vineae]